MAKKIVLLCTILFILSFVSKTTFAQTPIGKSIIPDTQGLSQNDCADIFDPKKTTDEKLEEAVKANDDFSAQILGCSIATGHVKLWMIPYYIRYLAQFLIALAGIVCMFFIVLGGYYYVFSGIGGDNEKGKKTILYACVGLIITSLAWIIVNVVLFAVSR